jgi:hypothetical protein
MCARPAVRGYGEEVVARADRLGLTAVLLHPPGPCELRLDLTSTAIRTTVGWRVDTGWFRRVPGAGDATAADIHYRDGVDLLDRLVPRPSRVADWLASSGHAQEDGVRPAVAVVGHTTTSAVLTLLHSCMRREPRRLAQRERR